LLALPLLVLSCAEDAADHEYFAALRGEETGMTRTEQLAQLVAVRRRLGEPHPRMIRPVAERQGTYDTAGCAGLQSVDKHFAKRMVQWAVDEVVGVVRADLFA